MNYGSVCSGIEAATVAVDPLGWKPAWFSEIEKFPSKVLNYHYPHVPNLGNMLTLENNETFRKSTIELLVGGTPCQSFSLAGLRGGMATVGGNLSLEFCRILIAKKPRWFWWENVPGVFSSFTNETTGKDLEGSGSNNERTFSEKADFATLLAAFQECGYSCAWRVLDSQHFGVPQRRRRVFIVGHIGNDWRPPFAVLFEPKSRSGNIKTGEKAREDVAGTIDASFGGSRGAGSNPGLLVAETITAGARKADRGDQKNLVIAPLVSTYGNNQGMSNQDIKQGLPHLVPCWWDGSQTAGTLDATMVKGHQTMPEKNRFPAILEPDPVFYDILQATNKNNRQNPKPGVVPTISSSIPSMVTKNRVRRLTPLECERLQGFPDNYTNIPGAKDGPRYKALGNSMTVNVMRWIAKRIEKVDNILKQQ